MQAVCAKCSRLMCRAIVLFLVAECAQTTPMIAPLPGDPSKFFFQLTGPLRFSSRESPTQPNPTPPHRPSLNPPPPPWGPSAHFYWGGVAYKSEETSPPCSCPIRDANLVPPGQACAMTAEPHDLVTLC